MSSTQWKIIASDALTIICAALVAVDKIWGLSITSNVFFIIALAVLGVFGIQQVYVQNQAMKNPAVPKPGK